MLSINGTLLKFRLRQKCASRDNTQQKDVQKRVSRDMLPHKSHAGSCRFTRAFPPPPAGSWVSGMSVKRERNNAITDMDMWLYMI